MNPRLVLHPPPEVSVADNGLKFTDILFGFVIREVFLRLASWRGLQPYVRWQLILTSAVVLGSWIGFRRSRNRAHYEIKFFNLPWFRFVCDQFMLVFYFRLAILTPQTLDKLPPSAAEVVRGSLIDICLIFVLYLVWDILNVWMAISRVDSKPRYPEIVKNEMTPKARAPDLAGTSITAGALFLLIVLTVVPSGTQTQERPVLVVLIALFIVIGYRFAKEWKTSSRAATDSSRVPARASP